MKKTLFKLGITAVAGTLVLAGCSAGGSAKDDGKETITFINHKTDWEGNGKWDEYIAKFNEKYPDIKVEVQTITEARLLVTGNARRFFIKTLLFAANLAENMVE